MKKTIIAAIFAVSAIAAGYIAPANATTCYTYCNHYTNSCTTNCY